MSLFSTFFILIILTLDFFYVSKKTWYGVNKYQVSNIFALIIFLYAFSCSIKFVKAASDPIPSGNTNPLPFFSSMFILHSITKESAKLFELPLFELNRNALSHPISELTFNTKFLTTPLFDIVMLAPIMATLFFFSPPAETDISHYYSFREWFYLFLGSIIITYVITISLSLTAKFTWFNYQLLKRKLYQEAIPEKLPKEEDKIQPEENTEFSIFDDDDDF
jgi:hypothetical protein